MAGLSGAWMLAPSPLTTDGPNRETHPLLCWIQEELEARGWSHGRPMEKPGFRFLLCQDLEGGLMAPHSQRAEVGSHKLQQSPQKPAGGCNVCRGRR